MQEILLVTHPSMANGRIFGGDPKAHESWRPFQMPYRALKSHLSSLGYDLKTFDQTQSLKDSAAVVFIEMQEDNSKYYRLCIENGLKDKMYLITWEPPSMIPTNADHNAQRPFKRILTVDDTLIDNKRYFRIEYPLPMWKNTPVRLPRIAWKQKKLCCLVATNKFSPYGQTLYEERVRAVRFLEKYYPQDFDLFGTYWDTPVIRRKWASLLKINGAICRLWKKVPALMKPTFFRSYKGIIREKRDILPSYKFTLAYENTILPGYLTEKILEALFCGCIPIYLGEPHIEEKIPKNCFIDKREFDSYPKLFSFLSQMSESEHNTYLDNIECFLNSDASYLFTIDAFIQNFKKMLDIKT